MFFTFSISKIFRSVRARLAAYELITFLDLKGIEEVFGLIPGVDCAKPIPGLNETSFVDDGAQPLIADSDKIVDVVRQAIVIIDSEFSRFGLILNYTAGKTEALIVLKGVNAYSARVELLVHAMGLVRFVNDQGIVNSCVLLINIKI